MEENNEVKELETVDGVYVDNEMTLDTMEIPDNENPDDREYEQVEIESEEGL